MVCNVWYVCNVCNVMYVMLCNVWYGMYSKECLVWNVWYRVFGMYVMYGM